MLTKNTSLPTTFTLNCRGRLMDLRTPVIMGIINLTEDSFYAASRLNDKKMILEKADQYLKEGASILDLGGQSTRPHAPTLSMEEEKNKVIPAIKDILKEFPEAIISVDTFYSQVAESSIQAGAHIINDISAGNWDLDMIRVVGQHKVPYVIMHMQGTPENMQQAPFYNHLIQDILDFFIAKINQCRKSGIQDIIIDPGFGFGKTISHNYSLLKHLSLFSMLKCPVLTGLSRKSMISSLLQTTPDLALNGTSALHMIALANGASILRVHDVAPAMEVIKLWLFFKDQP
ncbi:MAG: dihydropteroate synthase [Chitinophagaceae bacterium]